MKIKYFSLLLAMFLLLGLTACGKTEEKTQDNPEKVSQNSQEEKIYYIPEMISFSSSARGFDDVCVVGDSIYMFEMAIGDEVRRLFRLSAQGGEAEELTDFQPALSERATAITSRLWAGADGALWTYEIFYYITEDRQDSYVVEILRQLDENGKELARYEYPRLNEKGMGNINDLLVDGDGDVFANTDAGVALLDANGDPRFILLPDSDDSSAWPILLGDGRLAVPWAVMVDPAVYDWSLRVIDKEAEGWGETIPVAAGTMNLFGNQFYGGSADALFYYIQDNILYAYREGKGTEIVDLQDAGIDSSRVYGVFPLSDGGLVLQCGWGDSDDPLSLYVLKASDTPPAEKKELTFATLGLSGKLPEAILAFNRSSEEYHISVTDYSQYGSYEAALSRLSTEVGAGKMPDLIDLHGLPVNRWAAGGLLEDLWPYIDSDSELGREALMERALQSAEVDGKLYQVSQTFRLSTVAGLTSVVGDRMTWTGEDMWKALEAMPEGCQPVIYSRAYLLADLVGTFSSRFIDWEAGACDFTGGEFRSLLEFCAGFPENPRVPGKTGEQLLYEGLLMLDPMAVSSFYDIQRERYLLGGDISFVGYPNEWGAAGSSLSLAGGVAMSSECKDKEGAWSFLRTLLLPHTEAWLEENSYESFPINKADFQRTAELAMEAEYELDRDGSYLLDNNGEKIEIRRPFVERTKWFDGAENGSLYYYAVTQAEYDQIMALYNAADTSIRWDSDLSSIVTEAAGAYFAGDKTLDEAVDLIQGRATLYVSEVS